VVATDYPDFEGPKQKLYLTPEWGALVGVDKNIVGNALNKAPATSLTISHIVPAGKQLYLTQFSCVGQANLAADAELNQMVIALLYDLTALTSLYWIGGNGGAMAPLSKPIVIPAGHQVDAIITNRSNHNCDLWGGFGGYEV